MITREEYMKNSSELHQKYYEQFVTEDVKRLAKSVLKSAGWTIEEVAISYKHDKYINFVALKFWDMYFDSMPRYVFENLRKSGDMHARSLGNSVCLLKAATRLLIQELNRENENG